MLRVLRAVVCSLQCLRARKRRRVVLLCNDAPPGYGKIGSERPATLRLGAPEVVDPVQGGGDGTGIKHTTRVRHDLPARLLIQDQLAASDRAAGTAALQQQQMETVWSKLQVRDVHWRGEPPMRTTESERRCRRASPCGRPCARYSCSGSTLIIVCAPPP